MVLPEPARLSARALTWLLAAERIGEPHPVVAPTAMWHAPNEVDELNAQAREEIAALGWYDRRKRLEIEVEVALAMLCRGEEEYFGWATRDRVTIGVLAAGIGKHGLLAVHEGDSVWLTNAGRGVLARRLVGQLPDVPAGPGKPVTVARAELRGSARGGRFTEAAVRVGPATVAVRRIRELVALPTIGGGELYAAARDGGGRYRVSDEVRCADTHQGRYLYLSVGRDQVLVAPAGPEDLVARLADRYRLLITCR